MSACGDCGAGGTEIGGLSSPWLPSHAAAAGTFRPSVAAGTGVLGNEGAPSSVGWSRPGRAEPDGVGRRPFPGRAERCRAVRRGLPPEPRAVRCPDRGGGPRRAALRMPWPSVRGGTGLWSGLQRPSGGGELLGPTKWRRLDRFSPHGSALGITVGNGRGGDSLVSHRVLTSPGRPPVDALLAGIGAPQVRPRRRTDTGRGGARSVWCPAMAGGMGVLRFKPRKDKWQLVRFTANAGWKITPSRKLRLPKVGDVRVKWSRTLPPSRPR